MYRYIYLSYLYDVSSHSPTAPQQTLQMEQDVDLELIQEREQAIHKLESDIMDVNQIFKDLGMLVHEQGEVIGQSPLTSHLYFNYYCNRYLFLFSIH